MNEILITLIIAVGLNILLFIPAYFFRTDKITDVSYALTFMVIGVYGLVISGGNLPSIILFFMILLWAMRLGIFLFIRINKMGKDTRFDERRNDAKKFFMFWFFQGITVWAVLLPSILIFSNKLDAISSFAYIGLAIWFIGLLIETIADMQKYQFNNHLRNKGKWIAQGLWKYSRHPNYFGEIALWVGVYVFCLAGFTGYQFLIGLVGPLYIATILIFVSGIPLLEKSADKKWGNDQKYQEYKKKTSVLILWPNKK